MDADLDSWLSAHVVADFGTEVGYDEVALEFFRGLFAECGALTGEQLWEAAVSAQEALAADAIAAVATDLAATLPDHEFTLAAVRCGFVLRVTCNDAFSAHDGGRMVAFGAARARLEVATTVQDLVTEQGWLVWPECPEHGRALLAESATDPAWVCRTGPHRVAAVGSLAEAVAGSGVAGPPGPGESG